MSLPDPQPNYFSEKMTERRVLWKTMMYIFIIFVALLVFFFYGFVSRERDALREKLGSEEIAIRLHPECMKVRLQVITGSRLETGWEQAERCSAQHATHAGMEK